MPGDRLLWVGAVASVRLPATCYRLAAHLAKVATDGTGTAYASRRTLAAAIGCDEARLKPAFRLLAAAGFIVRGKLDGPTGRQTYRWHLVVPGAEVAPRARSAPRAEVARPGGAEVVPNGVRKSPPKRGRKEGVRVGGRFAPPALADVAAYCEERGNRVDPQRFMDHYVAVGWKVGRTPMKDWQAAVRTWEGRGRGRDRDQERNQDASAVRRDGPTPSDADADWPFAEQLYAEDAAARQEVPRG